MVIARDIASSDRASCARRSNDDFGRFFQASRGPFPGRPCEACRSLKFVRGPPCGRVLADYRGRGARLPGNSPWSEKSSSPVSDTSYSRDWP